MGVPKFFRFISERYPCISELINKDAHVCDFDNLYLDMNGIIHICSHPNDSDPHFRISEEKMLRDIFQYIAYLFQIINPKKVFFMAVDGVAPRAKMNHQRSRRFQTARDANKKTKEALEKGEVLPDTKQFDNNSITPGTVFMVRLHEQLRYFIKHKISTDRTWAKCKVILSGQDAPGEGEHKIMDYIRHIRKQPGYDPNTRHCLYGLDADLIMLGFCTHEPNFSILREEVIFKKNIQRPSTPDANNFYLLHLSLLKNYIELEFSILKDKLPFGFDMDKIIDDWVLMGFLVGNDFIPNLPNMLINNNALPQLYDVYKEILPTLDGYINEDGILNLKRFEVYLTKLADIDRKNFEEVYADLKYFEGKTGRRLTKGERKSLKYIPDDEETFGIDINEIKNENKSSGFKDDLQKLIASTNKLAVDCEDLIDLGFSDDEEKNFDSSEDLFDVEFMMHKKDYYMNKLKYENVTEDVLKSQAEGYVRAIQWILNYYYRGCCSWSWFYPHHYAPFLSDVINFENMEIKFDLGEPFLPFQQLLGVLPVASKDLLPEVYHHLMTSKDSPIYKWYPEDFETDLNGKLQQWEAVTLIPFIDEEELLSAMSTCDLYLTEEERRRNSHGPMLIYEYTNQNLGIVSAPDYFPRIPENHATEVSLWVRDMLLSPGELIRGPLPNIYKDAYFPGVPTLNHIDFTFSIQKAGIKVFEFPSRNDSFILTLSPVQDQPSLETLAPKLLGKIIWVGWPYLTEAKVLSLSDKRHHISYISERKSDNALTDDEIYSVIKSDNKSEVYVQWLGGKSAVNKHYMQRLGIDVGQINVTVHAVNVKGYKYVHSGDGKLVHNVEWCSVPVLYPLQTILTDLEVAPIARPKLYKTIEEAFPIGDSAFIISGSYYASMAEIVDVSDITKTGRMKVDIITEPEPTFTLPNQFAISTYLPARVAAAKCGLPSILFSRITASIYIVPKSNGKEKKNEKNVNIGLGLKFPKTNEEISGFTHRVDKNWTYSLKCVSLVYDYFCRFYDMFQRMERFINMDDIFEHDLFPENSESILPEITEWINNQSFKKYPTRKCSTIALDPEELIFVYDTVESQAQYVASNRKKIGLKIKPHVLFKAELRIGIIPPDLNNATFKLFDRVVNISQNCSVPFGYKGTVVSIINNDDLTNSVKFTDNLNCDPTCLVQFDKTFPNGSTMEGVPGKRFYVMQSFNMLNITAGCRSQDQINKVQINNRVVFPTPKSPEKIHIPNQNNFHNLRSDDGHNSAFASYSNPMRIQEPKPVTNEPVYTKIMQRPTKFEIPPFQMKQISNILNPNLNLENDRDKNDRMNLPYPSFQNPPIFNQQIGKELHITPQNNNQEIPSDPNNESRTQMLKFLLKIDKDDKAERGFSNVSNNSPDVRQNNLNENQIQSQEFYRTPPSKTQLPFPAKLIDVLNNTKIEQQNCINTPQNYINTPQNYINTPQNYVNTPQTFINSPQNFVNSPQNSSSKPLKNYTISTPFVPLQVTKKIMNSNNNKVVDDSPPTSSEIETTNVDSQVFISNTPANSKPRKNSAKKKNVQKKSKSRVAANFANP